MSDQPPMSIDGIQMTTPKARGLLRGAFERHGCSACCVLPISTPHVCEHGVTPAPRVAAHPGDLSDVDPDFAERLAHVWLRHEQ
jgi:hypothetical protein